MNQDVPYEPGVLWAVGKHRDGTVACHAEIRSASVPAAVRLSADRDTITTGPGDVAHVTFEIVDSAGTVVPTADNLVRITATGGTVLVVDNANLKDLDPYSSERRHTFNGRGWRFCGRGKQGCFE